MSTLTNGVTATSARAAHKPSRRPETPHGGAGTLAEVGSSTTTNALRAATGKAASLLASVIVVLAVTAFLLLAVGPRVFGYQTATMLTGSMAPLINPGDVVVTLPTPVRDIGVGDIITYRIPVEDHRVETHRVTEILTNADGTRAVRTKGDANNGVDPWTATLQGSAVDKHVVTVPYAGQAIRALRQPLVLGTLTYGAPAVLVIGLLASIWRKDPEAEAAGQ